MGSIDSFRTNFKPIHSNRFLVQGTIPNQKLDLIPFEVYVKSTQIPGSTIGLVSLNYRGRKVNFPSEQGFQDWAINFHSSNKKDHDFRILFEQWKYQINNMEHTKLNYRLTTNWSVYYGETEGNNFTRRIDLFNCFPLDISSIELSNDTPDTIVDFIATISYDYSYLWDIDKMDQSRGTN